MTTEKAILIGIKHKIYKDSVLFIFKMNLFYLLNGLMKIMIVQENDRKRKFKRNSSIFIKKVNDH